MTRSRLGAALEGGRTAVLLAAAMLLAAVPRSALAAAGWDATAGAAAGQHDLLVAPQEFWHYAIQDPVGMNTDVSREDQP